MHHLRMLFDTWPHHYALALTCNMHLYGAYLGQQSLATFVTEHDLREHSFAAS